MGGRIDRKLLLRPITVEVALEHARAQWQRQSGRAIGGVRIDEQDLVAEAHRADTGCDPVRFVVRDDAGGNLSATSGSRHAHLAASARAKGLE